MSDMVNPVTRIMQLVKLEKDEISGIYFHAILNGLIQLSLPVGVQAIIGFVLGGAVSSSLILLISLVVLGVLFTGMLQIGQMRLIEKVQQKIFVRYSYTLAERIPRINLNASDNYYLPELVNRFFEVPTLQKSLAKLLLDIPTATIQILFGLLLLSFYHPAFILFGLLLMLVLWLILYYTGSRGLSSSLAESMYKYRLAAWLQEVARLVKTFKFSKGASLNLDKADGHTGNYLDARNEHYRILEFQYKILVAFKVLITAAMLIVGSILLVNQQLNIGQFIAAEIIIITIIASVEKLIGNLDSVYDVMTSIQKIAKVTEQPVEEHGSMVLPVDDAGLHIQVHDLKFGYDERKLVLRNINVDIPAGSKLCITGRESTGKSTFLKLLTGAYDHYSGAILIEGLPPGNYDKKTLREQTGIMLHQQDIFNGSIWENVTMGNRNISLPELTRLFTMTGLDLYLAGEHKGLDTILDTAGKRLPERIIRKILLVRALVGRPRLLLLEEPWLGMSTDEAAAIRQYLLSLPATTVIVVSNDEQFANSCDHILKMG
ncbi:MAG: ATP-binding cassette domain-containing protein [Chitinophagaceae bacterium]|nr:MAG: ATP-binding cassette domain-containing protein [Chitinophagaceae bacterium]